MFELKFSTDSAAFCELKGITLFFETARILTELAPKVANGQEDGIIVDYNGNTIGEWYLDVPKTD